MTLRFKRDWVRCQVSLERSWTPKPVYVTATFSFYEANGKRAHTESLGPCDQEPVDEMLALIQKQGFKRTQTSSIREWAEATYERNRPSKIKDEWMRCDLTLEKTAQRGFAYDSVKTVCYDGEGERVHSDTQLKVKQAPVQKFIDALTTANFKVTHIDTVMYTKTYRYERDPATIDME